MADLPQFAAGEFYKIQAAIDVGVLRYPSYVFIRDECKLAFIDQDLSIKRIVGDNQDSVVKVEKLPDVTKAKENVLYILDGIVYTFDGANFISMYKDSSSDLEQIRTDISNLSGRITTLEKNAHSPIQWMEL